MSEYDKGYRAGAMAERRRTILVALQATNSSGLPCSVGLEIAHQIGRAGTQRPVPATDDPEKWSVYGEKRKIRDTPTFLERRCNPFTAIGEKYVAMLISKLDVLGIKYDDENWALGESNKVQVAYLEEKLADAPGRIQELEDLVAKLSLQLSGVIG